MKELKSWFSKRGYPDRIISEQVNRALRSEENVKERDGKHMKENGVPLVVTYNPNFKNLRILIRKNLQFLYADPEISLNHTYLFVKNLILVFWVVQ